MAVTDEDREAVRDMLNALRALNSTIAACSKRDILVEFSDSFSVVGQVNRTFICTKMERVKVERILP